MKIAIKDANVLIDLELAGLFDLWFRLGYETYVTDLIVGELRKGGHMKALSYAEAGMLHVEKCSPDFMMEAVNLMNEIGGGPGITDCSVLLLAMKRDAMLLSGDGALRKDAQVRQVEVHGTIWIFDELIENTLLKPIIAARKLENLLLNNRFLPLEVCEKRIESWRTSDAGIAKKSKIPS